MNRNNAPQQQPRPHDAPEQVRRLAAEEAAGSSPARKGMLIIAAAVAIAALGYFAAMAFQSATVYSYTVGEMNALGPTPEGKLVRVNGSLAPDTFTRPDGSTLAYFTLADEADAAQTIPAMYEGVLPDLFFNEHSEIILEGARGPDGVFAAQNVLVKCPSKYIALEEEGASAAAGETGNAYGGGA